MTAAVINYGFYGSNIMASTANPSRTSMVILDILVDILHHSDETAAHSLSHCHLNCVCTKAPVVI